MTAEMLQIIMSLIAMAMQYGVPAVEDVVATLEKDTVTIDDINALKSKIKPPEQY